MILRRMMEHVDSQNWFAVALDFFVVVSGVGLALWAETQLSERALIRDVEAFEAAILTERNAIYLYSQERLATRTCRAERIAELSEALREPAGPWAASGWDMSGGPAQARLGELDSPIREPYRLWPTQTWQAGKRRGLTEKIPTRRAQFLEAIFSTSETASRLQDDLFRSWAELAPLAYDTELTRVERNAYLSKLGQIDQINGLLNLTSSQMATLNETVGFEDMKDALPDDFDHAAMVEVWNGNGRSAYPDCWEEMTLDALNVGRAPE